MSKLATAAKESASLASDTKSDVKVAAETAKSLVSTLKDVKSEALSAGQSAAEDSDEELTVPDRPENDEFGDDEMNGWVYFWKAPVKVEIVSGDDLPKNVELILAKVGKAVKKKEDVGTSAAWSALLKRLYNLWNTGWKQDSKLKIPHDNKGQRSRKSVQKELPKMKSLGCMLYRPANKNCDRDATEHLVRSILGVAIDSRIMKKLAGNSACGPTEYIITTKDIFETVRKTYLKYSKSDQEEVHCSMKLRHLMAAVPSSSCLYPGIKIKLTSTANNVPHSHTIAVRIPGLPHSILNPVFQAYQAAKVLSADLKIATATATEAEKVAVDVKSAAKKASK